MPKAVFSVRYLDSCCLKPARKIHLFTFLFITTTTLIKYLSLLKEVLGAKSTHSTFSSSQGYYRYGSQHSHNTVPVFFSHGIVQCVLGVSLHSSETARKPVLRWGSRAESLASRRLGTEYPRGVNCTERDPWRSAGGPPGFQQHTDQCLCRRKLSKAGERSTQRAAAGSAWYSHIPELVLVFSSQTRKAR